MKYPAFLVLGFTIIGSLSYGSTTKKDFLAKFPIKEGHYDTVVNIKNKADFCEEEELDILLQEDDKDLTLTIGPKLVFAELQKPESVSKSEKNCKVTTTTSVGTNTLKQSITETCGKKMNYLKVHSFKLEKDTIEYTFSAKGSPASAVHCKYKFLKEVAAK